MSTPKKSLHIREDDPFCFAHKNSTFLPPNLSFTKTISLLYISILCLCSFYSCDPKEMESFMRLFLPLYIFFIASRQQVSSESISRESFPDGFVFGTASSAYQVTFFSFFYKLIQERFKRSRF